MINFNHAFSFGWEIIKKHWLFLLQISIVSFLVTLPLSIVDTFWNETSYFKTLPEIFLYIVFVIFYWVLSLTLMYNTFKINLDILHERSLNFKDLFSYPTETTIRYFAASFIYGVLVFAGLICFIIPGIYFAIKYMFTTTLIVDKGMPVFKAAEKSAEMVKGEMWQIFAFELVLLLSFLAMIIIGLLCLLVGVIPAAFIAGWIATFANLYIYRKLSVHKA